MRLISTVSLGFVVALAGCAQPQGGGAPRGGGDGESDGVPIEPLVAGELTGTVRVSFSEESRVQEEDRETGELTLTLNLRLRRDEEDPDGDTYIDDGSTYAFTTRRTTEHIGDPNCPGPFVTTGEGEGAFSSNENNTVSLVIVDGDVLPGDAALFVGIHGSAFMEPPDDPYCGQGGQRDVIVGATCPDDAAALYGSLSDDLSTIDFTCQDATQQPLSENQPFVDSVTTVEGSLTFGES